MSKPALRASVACVGIAAAIAAAPAAAGGGRYTIEGGTPREQAQVRAALETSAFDWGIVPPVTIRIVRGGSSSATPGRISLNAELVAAGRFAWGVIQHEYAHQVDMLVLSDADRVRLSSVLGGDAWWPTGALGHGALTSERFASTLAWAYWQSQDNVMRPESVDDEAGAVAAPAFRALLTSLLRAHEVSVTSRR